jgi:chromosome segregation protein
MLKALELYGFKSFADKTRFEFPPGITVVVGPNGSGKSNIVDAIKWVLGEQSAKSLRGKEMADVIFKGSGAGSRKMMNTAEATIIFDNSEGRLPVDSAEVHVTRRVYRSGEGEYLINGQPCRLKDIRDMFRGTGVGADAYSLIEQGKVDQLLQASSKERRAIFEEAAGISRFKAKKLEAQRRLERVDQNLLRLSDIVEEVENRLKNVRNQASKARRYREYTERLQQLRTHVGWTDWRKLTAQLEGFQQQFAAQQEAIAALHVEAEQAESRAADMERELAAAADQVHEGEGRLARHREQVAARLSLCDHERARCRELDEEAALHRAQWVALSGRAVDVQQRLQEIDRQLRTANTAHEEISARLETHTASLDELTRQWDTRRLENEALRAGHVEQMRGAAQWSNEAGSRASQIAAAEQTAARAQRRWEESQAQLLRNEQELREIQETERQLREEIEQQAVRLEDAQRDLAQNRRLLARRQEDLAQLGGRLRGVRERAAVLEELENKREGVLPGVRQLLEAARHRPEDEVLREVRGIVADLIRADVQWAPLIDAALGSNSQLIVLNGSQLVEQLQEGQFPLAGRVGLIALSEIPRRFEFRRVQWEGRAGVMGRADRFVEFDSEYGVLVEYLLGRTYFVESLREALLYYQMAPGRARFVTLAGEVVERDGTLTVGPPQASASLISRRSELQQLRAELAGLEKQCETARQEIGRLTENIAQEELAVRKVADRQNELQETFSDQRVRSRTMEARCDQLRQQTESLESELQAARSEIESSTAAMQAAQQKLTEVECLVREIEQRLEADRRDLEKMDQRRQEHLREATRARVELATSEQRLIALRAQRRQCEDDHLERSRAIAESRLGMQRCLERRLAAERAILQATSELAQIYLDKEADERSISQQLQLRQQLQSERTAVAGELQTLRRKLRKLEDQAHQLELQAGQLHQQRSALEDRIREDYGIEMSQLEADPAEGMDQEERESIEAEIESLRRKISQIGAVNMEALEELDETESRYAKLAEQHQDLVQAKASLERIIQKINADSRRLFLETLEAIRANFQSIYRKAFGGGKADIVLEEGADVLECGVEILATPPGKPTFNNSLLSGGEKALTAVSLLLAIFQFRPSPFCVLDEVDAPFDEANIGRFIDVLKEFLGWTKFVIVTHSKKTMTAATTLYGVTMQESGVSKRVSVRFEDVSDDGEIAAEALSRELGASAGDERGVA